MRSNGWLVIAVMMMAGCASPRLRVQERADLQHLFRDSGFAGTTVVYDVSADRYITVNGDRADSGYLPASTFKVFNSLVGLETGVVQNEHTVFKWDGVTRDREALNRDHDLASAFANSVVWYYQIIARGVGQDRMQRYIDRVGYGNRKITPKIDTFWLDGDLRIGAREQVDFLTRLYRNQLPFSQGSIDIVKKIMINEQTPQYTLRAKTGWARAKDYPEVGWWIGWVERFDGHVFVFATNLVDGKPAAKIFGPARMQITRAILRELGALPRKLESPNQ